MKKKKIEHTERSIQHILARRAEIKGIIPMVVHGEIAGATVMTPIMMMVFLGMLDYRQE